VDIGGATTDVFSVFGGTFNRTVSANLGMSYSVSNVLTEAGLENVRRWVPFDIDEAGLRNAIKNKMIRPTTIPQLLAELKIEQALAREALRLAFVQHKLLATGLKGVQRTRTISSSFDESSSADTIIDMRSLDLLVGSGGVLSHAPRRAQAMMMLVDAFQPEGRTRIAVDSIFMMPHLGVLTQVHESAAEEVFVRDCLINLGTCVSTVNRGKPGAPAFAYTLRGAGGQTREGALRVGEIVLETLDVDATAEVEVRPARGIDAGEGKGHPVRHTAHGGVVGVLFDARGRPLELPAKEAARRAAVAQWGATLELYPE